MKIRYSKKNEKEIAIKYWINSFKDSENEINFYFDNIFDYKNYLVLEKSGKIVSSLHENPYILNINSEEIKTKYIVGVSTPIEEQRKGYMKFLIENMLKKTFKDGFPFVFLTPINPNIYRRYGFEYFSKIITYNFHIENLADLEYDKTLEIIEINLDNKDKYIEDLIEIYNRSMKSKFSYLKRDKYYFNKLMLECFNENMKLFISYKNKEAKAYILFSKSDEELWVREIFAQSFKDKENILSILYAYKDYFRKININSSEDSNMEFLFKNQLNIQKIEEPFMMLRILNPLKVLELSNIKLENLKIYIEDTLIPENTGLYFFNKSWKFSKDSKEYDFKIDISNLVLLLFGFFSFQEMKYTGKIEINDFKQIENEQLIEIFSKKISYLYEFQ